MEQKKHDRLLILVDLMEKVRKHFDQTEEVKFTTYVFDSICDKEEDLSLPFKPGALKSNMEGFKRMLFQEYGISKFELIADIPAPLLTWANVVGLIIDHDEEFINSL